MTLGETEFHCFCCKKKVKAVKGSISFDVYKNGRSAMRGLCSIKSCKLSKIISDNAAKTLKAKYSYEIIKDEEEDEEEEQEQEEFEFVNDKDDEEDDDKDEDKDEDEDEDDDDEDDEQVPSYVSSSRVPSYVSSSHVPSYILSSRVPSYVSSSRVPSYVSSSQQILSRVPNIESTDSDNSIGVAEIGGFFALVGLLATSIVVGMKTNI